MKSKKITRKMKRGQHLACYWSKSGRRKRKVCFATRKRRPNGRFK